MEFTVRKMMCALRWSKGVSILMIVEMMLGVAVLVYSLNMSYSLSKAEDKVNQQKWDLVLEISENVEEDISMEPVFTKEDYQKIQEITGNQAFCYIVLPQFYSDENDSYEYQLLLADYEQMGLDAQYAYRGSELDVSVKQNINLASSLKVKKMPASLDREILKSDMEETRLRDSILLPLTYMEQFREDITGVSVHVVWDSTTVPDLEKSIAGVEDYLKDEHGKFYHYRMYSPGVELENNTQKTKISIQALNKTALLFLIVFFVGMLAVFQLRFEDREDSYGVSLSCGADYKQIFYEIFLEIMVINGVGTLIGALAGSLFTRYIDMGIMVGDIQVSCHLRSILTVIAVCAVMGISVSILIFRKLQSKTVVRLLSKD